MKIERHTHLSFSTPSSQSQRFTELRLIFKPARILQILRFFRRTWRLVRSNLERVFFPPTCIRVTLWVNDETPSDIIFVENRQWSECRGVPDRLDDAVYTVPCIRELSVGGARVSDSTYDTTEGQRWGLWDTFADINMHSWGNRQTGA